jgi:tetratricopeptide (TPR) repeat protein
VSPKNKGKTGTPSTAVEPDQFVAGVTTFADRLKPHVGKLVAVVGLLLVAAVAFITWRWWDGRNEAKASALYAQAMEILNRRVDPPKEADPTKDASEPAEPAALPGEEEEDKPITYPSIKVRAETALKALDKLAADFGGTDVDRSARMLRAAALDQAGRGDDAAKLYQDVATSEGGEIASLAREQLGYVYEAKAMAAADPSARQAGLTQALEQFKLIQPKDGATRRDLALYHEGRILGLMDKHDEAVAALEKALAIVNKNGAKSALKTDIERRLALLDAQVAVQQGGK